MDKFKNKERSYRSRWENWISDKTDSSYKINRSIREDRDLLDTQESKSWDIFKDMLSSLSLSPHRNEIKNLGMLSRAINLIEEMKQEDILDENDAKTLFEYIAYKFVENHISGIFENVSDIGFNEDFLENQTWKETITKKAK